MVNKCSITTQYVFIHNNRVPILKQCDEHLSGWKQVEWFAKKQVLTLQTFAHFKYLLPSFYSSAFL